MKQTYIRCPRCELNYILKKDKFCNVCKQEMKALGTLGAEENLDLELCPLCKINYINPDEDICPACAKEREMEDGEGTKNKYGTSEWDAYTSPEDDEDSSYEDEEVGDMVSISNLDDSPLGDDDDMDLDLSDEEDEVEDETFDSEFDDTFDDLDDDDVDDDDYDDEEVVTPKKKKK